MKQKSLFTLGALLVIFSFVLGACAPQQPAATQAPAATEAPVMTEAPAATEAPATTEAPAATEAPTEAPAPTKVPIATYDGKSLTVPDCDYGGTFKSIEAVDDYTVTFTLCHPDAAFLAKIALSEFAIFPKAWLEKTAGPGKRTTEGIENPVGTGPYMVKEWKRGESITLVKNPNYWNAAAVTGANTIIFRWQAESAARLLELQSGTVDGIDNVGPTDFETVKNDPNLQLVPRQPLNVGYIGTNPRFAPMDNVKVRQAIAMGIDRQRIVDTFYPEGSTVAEYFTPCAIANGCVGDPWYKFDPEAAKKLLAEAGFPDGFQTKLYYRENPRPYLPEPARIAEEIQAQLKQNLNIDAQPTPMESGAFLDAAFSGKLDGLYLLGWIADYPHITDYLDYHFNPGNPQFGDIPASITEPLAEAAKIADPEQAKPYYEKANNALKESALVIPFANGVSATAYKKDVENPQASPLGMELFAFSKPDGRDTFIFMQSAEPANLFSADEDDGEALRVSDQIMEGLYTFKVNTTEVVPALAESCTPNEDGTVWTCKLRQGVKFSDGSDFTAADVVATFNMGLNPGSPTHVGNTNNWSFYAPLWGLMEK